MRSWIKFIASVGYLGHVPLMSGTITSAVFTFVIYYWITNPTLYFFLGAFVIIIGLLISSRAAFIYNHGDPREVVIDELAGLFVALFFIPHQARAFLIAFLLFRFFDILKPWPIRALEKIRGSLGIMLDDLLAGLLANLITHFLLRYVL